MDDASASAPPVPPRPPGAPDHPGEEARARRDEAALSLRYNLLAVVRLLVFLVLALTAAAVVATPGPAAFGGLLASGLAFLLLALWHADLDDRRTACRRRAEYHRRGAERMAGRWDHGQADGLAFLPADHPYAADLDVVGPRSLYALLDTAGGAGGRRRLADWLLDDDLPLDAQRAELVADLAARHDWRAGLFALGSGPGADDDGRDLDAWLAQRPRAPARAWMPAIALLRLAVLVALGWAAWRHGLPGAATAAIAVAVALLPLDGWARRRLAPAFDVEQTRLIALAQARRLAHLAALAGASGLHPRLQSLAAAAASGERASAALARCCDALARRANPLWAMLVSPLLLGEWRAAGRLQEWAARHAGERPGWLSALAEAEALACLATYAAEQGGCFATWDAAGPALEARDLAHPLLPRASRVGNDVVVAGGQVLLLTGANASGKSTFLRACALGLILARCGAPLPAASCRLRPMRLATVMRVQDDLGAGRSRFQAEVAALRRIFTRLAAPGLPLLVVLDEVLAGTNSRERHLGTRAMLAAMRSGLGAVLVSSHDLELCRLADAEPARFQLAHFADRAAEGETGGDLLFDYRLRPGALRTTNALRVMRAAGLPVDEQLDADG